jgi:hypothetical protein
MHYVKTPKKVAHHLRDFRPTIAEQKSDRFNNVTITSTTNLSVNETNVVRDFLDHVLMRDRQQPRSMFTAILKDRPLYVHLAQ